MDYVTLKDFQKFDIRIGTVREAQIPEWSHWVIKLRVDFGSDIGERVIFAGVLGFYDPKDLEGKQFPFIVNLEPKKIGPEKEQSQGMMLAAVVLDSKSDKKPVLLVPCERVPNGTKVA